MRTLSKKSQKLNRYIAENPDAKASAVAKLFKVTVQSVYQRKAKMKSAASKGNKFVTAKQMVKDVVNGYNKSVRQKPSAVAPTLVDKINHPSHYKVGGIETIDFIEAKDLGYHLGNVVKYISRADHKDNKLENLKKAQWYLNRAVSNLEKP
jgi:hypothetical protein